MSFLSRDFILVFVCVQTVFPFVQRLGLTYLTVYQLAVVIAAVDFMLGPCPTGGPAGVPVGIPAGGLVGPRGSFVIFTGYHKE